MTDFPLPGVAYRAFLAKQNPMTRSLIRLRTRCHREAAWGGLPENEKENIMTTIGTFKKDGNGYAGSIETLTLKAKITFESSDKKSGKAPDFRVFHIGDDFTSEIGAAWKKTSRENGAEYLSVSLDDPSFAEKINCRLVKTGSEQGHSLFWERSRPRD
jgi:uncharacterized protein (DUF736 family)